MPGTTSRIARDENLSPDDALCAKGVVEHDGFGLGRIAAERQVTLRGGGIPTIALQAGQMKVHLAQPARVGRLVGVRFAPGEVLQGVVALAEEAGDLCPHHARHPARDEDLAARQALGFVEKLHRVIHPADAAEQENVVRMAGAQRRNGRQVQPFVCVVQFGAETLQHVVEIGDAFDMAAGVCELAHQQKQQLRIGRRPPLVDLLQVGQLRWLAADCDGGVRRPITRQGERHQDAGAAGNDPGEPAKGVRETGRMTHGETSVVSCFLQVTCFTIVTCR